MRARRMSRRLPRLCELVDRVLECAPRGQSPDWLEDMLPLARTKPAMPRDDPGAAGARWWMKCCTQAELALPRGGTPN